MKATQAVGIHDVEDDRRYVGAIAKVMDFTAACGLSQPKAGPKRSGRGSRGVVAFCRFLSSICLDV